MHQTGWAKNTEEWSVNREYFQMLSEIPEEDIDLSQILLDVSRRVSKDLLGRKVNKRRALSYLKQAAQDLRQDLKLTQNSQEIVATLNAYIFEKEKFNVDRSSLFEGSLNNILFDQVLDNKRGHCLSLSLLYLCLAPRVATSDLWCLGPPDIFMCVIKISNI